MHIEIHETNMHLLLETATSYMLHVSVDVLQASARLCRMLFSVIGCPAHVVSIWLKLLVSLASVICLVLNQPLRRWIAELLLGLIGKENNNTVFYPILNYNNIVIDIAVTFQVYLVEARGQSYRSEPLS